MDKPAATAEEGPAAQIKRLEERFYEQEKQVFPHTITLPVAQGKRCHGQ